MTSLSVSPESSSELTQRGPVLHDNAVADTPPADFSPIEKPTPRHSDATTDKRFVGGNKAMRREQRRVARLAVVRRGAKTGCDGFKLLPTGSWKLANPGPIGLWGMEMTYILYSLHLTGHWEWFAVALGMMVVFGGGIQIVAGCLQYARGNTLAYTLFLLNGAFWLSVVGITNIPNNTRPSGSPIMDKPTSYFEGVFYLLWAVVSLFLLGASLYTNLVTVCMLTAQLLFFILLAIGYMAEAESVKHAGGYAGIVCGGLAGVLGYGAILNEVFDRVVVPVFPMRDIWMALGLWKEKNTT